MSFTNTSLTLYPKLSSGKYGATYTHESPITIAPLTLNIPEGSRSVSKTDLTSMLQAAGPSDYKIPRKSFDIRTDLPNDLTIVRNQGACGSCWAFSSATAIADCITKREKKTGKNIQSSVKISPASFFNLTGQPWANGCQGGNPVNAAQYIFNQKVPLVTDNCSDYSWYLVPYINQTDEGKECDNCNQVAQQYQSLGGLVPGREFKNGPPCIAKAKKGEHWQFRLSGVVSNGTNDSNMGMCNLLDLNNPPDEFGSMNTNIEASLKNRIQMMNFLINTGSFPVGISILPGFMPGGSDTFTSDKVEELLGNSDINVSWVKKGTDMPVSVYVQDMRYDNTLMGGHAVTVVGWNHSDSVHQRAVKNLDYCFGSGKGKAISDMVSSHIGGNSPLGWYWIIRNSWGTVWPSGKGAGGGYFGLCMFPGNPLVQWTLPYNSRASDRPASNLCKDAFAKSNPNPKSVFFSMYVGMIPGDTCGGPDKANKCDKPLQHLSTKSCESENLPLFTELDKMLPSKSAALVAGQNTKARVMKATNADSDTIANWSNYLSDKASKLKNRACIYADNSENVSKNKPSPGGYNDPGKKGLSTGAIIGIAGGVLTIILAILFLLFR